MENTEENKKINIKLYPIYRAIALDFLFYYAISFIFLVQVKNMDVAEVIFADSFFPIFKCVLLIPMTILIEKVGKKKSIIFANCMNALTIFIYLIAGKMTDIIIAQFFSAMATAIKGIAETNLLYDSLPKNEKRGSEFSKIDGKGMSSYYCLDGISSAISGFLFVINGYLPMIASFITCLVSIFLATRFKEINDSKNKNINSRIYVKDLKYSFKCMLKSNRLRYLLILGSLITGTLGALTSVRSGILEELNVSEQYFGIIFAILGFISAITSRKQNKINKKFRNKTLAVISLPITITCIIIGLIMLSDFNYSITLIIVLLCFVLQYISKGPSYTLVKRYLNNFTTSSLRNKITPFYNLIDSATRAIISFASAFLIKKMGMANSVAILGCVLTIFVVILLDRMRGKVGIKPEKYKKSEIEFLELK